MRPFLLAPALLLAAASPSWAGEKEVATSGVPAAVLAAVAAGYPGASIVEASTEVDDGVNRYEVGIKLGERSLDLAYAPDGTQLEEEENVTIASTPAPVQATVATYTGWSVKRVERATATGVTTYEVLLLQGKKRMELMLDPAGKVKDTEKSSHAEEQ